MHPCRSLVEYMTEDVNYVVTNSKWDDNFDEVSLRSYSDSNIQYDPDFEQ